MSANAPELHWLLLAWCELHGRHTIPWALDPYGTVVAEVM